MLVQANDKTRICSLNAVDGKVVFDRLRLRINFLTLSPSVEARLIQQPSLRYPYHRMELTSIDTIPQGVQNVSLEVARGQVREHLPSPLPTLQKTSLPDSPTLSLWIHCNRPDAS
jgi:hypothetical protein